MARNSYLPWKVNRPNTCTKCRLYLYVHVLCNFKIRKRLSIFFSPLIFCSHLACDLNIDLHFIYITLMTSVDHIFSSANKYPVYAVQWHPEKNNFVWTSKAHINHDANAVRVSQYFADFFVAQGILFCCTINAVKLEK